MKKALKYSIIITLALLVLGIGLWFFLSPTSHPRGGGGASRIELVLVDDVASQEKLLQNEDVRHELKSLNIIPSTDSLFTLLEPHQIKALLEENDLYSSVAVFRNRGSRAIVIELEQRVPLFMVHPSDPAQSPYIVCTDKQIAKLPHRYKTYLPLVSGTLSQQYASGALYDLMKLLDEQAEWHQYFDHVYVHPSDGVILSPRLYNTAIYIGKDGDWSSRLHKLRVFEEQVLRKQGIQAYRKLKLQFGDQVIAEAETQQSI